MFPVIPQAILNFQNYKKRSKARRKLLLSLIASGEVNFDDEEAIEDDDYIEEKEPCRNLIHFLCVYFGWRAVT